MLRLPEYAAGRLQGLRCFWLHSLKEVDRFTFLQGNDRFLPVRLLADGAPEALMLSFPVNGIDA
jgi:hypothetical protein